MRKMTLCVGLIFMGLCCCLNVNAQSGRNQQTTDNNPFSSGWGFGIKASTNGIGFEVVKGFGDKVNLRIGTSSLRIPYDKVITLQEFDLLASANLSFGGISGFLDYQISKIVHITCGIIKNNMDFTVRITSAGDLPMGTIEVPAEEVGYVLADIRPQNSISPYIGIGFGRSLALNSDFSLNFEIGGIFHGEPQLVLSGDGIIGPIASEENTNIIMEALAPYKWFPLVTLELGFRLN